MKWLLIIAWVLPGTTVPQIKAEAADDLAHCKVLMDIANNPPILYSHAYCIGVSND